MTDSIEQKVARHYARDNLEETILAALVASGKDPDRLATSDLAPVDEFHTGGREATIEFAAQMDLAPGMHLLDIGCGIGGASRFVAETYGCRVTGIDLTEDFVRTADALARRVGLQARVSYRQGSALALPFPPATFDGAYMMHVGMNIEDKPALFRQVHGVLKAGGVFAIYDVLQIGVGALSFPLPCADTAETCFVATPTDYRRALEGAGFEIRKERDRYAFAVEFFRRVQASLAEGGGPPPLGIHLLMGEDAPQKLGAVVDNLDRGVIAPVEIICRRR
jgi:ubiquinone/menaquinone biosynthesis C-methylase UbiE